MKILYSSDFHGDEAKYTRILEIARSEKISVVVNGGDLLGSFHKHGKFMHKQQTGFLESFLRHHFQEYEDSRIHWIGTLGNDDLQFIDSSFDGLCADFDFIHNITSKSAVIEGYQFTGFSHVVDYPFSPKERCRRDTEDYVLEEQPLRALISKESGWEEIENWPETIGKLPTIYEMLNDLPEQKKPIFRTSKTNLNDLRNHLA